MKTAKKEIPVVLKTADAAKLINRSSQTMRRWASEGSGPIQPIRINHRLAWRLSDIENLLGA